MPSVYFPNSYAYSTEMQQIDQHYILPSCGGERECAHVSVRVAIGLEVELEDDEVVGI